MVAATLFPDKNHHLQGIYYLGWNCASALWSLEKIRQTSEQYKAGWRSGKVNEDSAKTNLLLAILADNS